MPPMNPFAVEARIRDLADRAATEFLAPLSEKRGSPDWIAKNAAKILAESGLDLTDLVVKVAHDENLNPHEVARVCEEANKDVFRRLYKDADDKTFEFKVADVNEALKKLDVPYEGPGDVFLPVEHPLRGPAKTAADKTESSNWARTALLPSTEQAAQLSLEEEKTARDAFHELRLEAEVSRHQAAIDFAKMARDLVLEGGRTPSEIFALVKEARPGKPLHEKAARELLALVALNTQSTFPEGADLVVKYGRSLLATSETGGGEQPSDDLRHVTQEQYDFWNESPGKRPEELVGPVSSGGDPVRIMNGRHALFVTLDTLVDQSGKEKSYEKGLLVAGDRVRTVTRQIVNWRPKTENIA